MYKYYERRFCARAARPHQAEQTASLPSTPLHSPGLLASSLGLRLVVARRPPVWMDGWVDGWVVQHMHRAQRMGVRSCRVSFRQPVRRGEARQRSGIARYHKTWICRGNSRYCHRECLPAWPGPCPNLTCSPPIDSHLIALRGLLSVRRRSV